MSCEYSINQAQELVLSDSHKKDVLQSLQTAQLDLKQASDECYQQHVLIEVSEGSYKLRPTDLEIGAALRSACKYAILSHTGEACWVSVDMTLVQHVVNNAQSNGLQFGDRSGKHPLRLTYSLERSSNDNDRQAVVTLRLTNIAGANQDHLIKIGDANGCIRMTDIQKFHNWHGSGRGLGTDIVMKMAKLLSASAHLEVTQVATTFVMSLPVQLCDSPTESPLPDSITRLHAPVKLSHVVVIQAHGGPVQNRALCLKMSQIGFDRVTLVNIDCVESISQAVIEVATAKHPSQAIFVERCLNMAGLSDTDNDGMHIIRTLSRDIRVSAMLLLYNIPVSPVPEDDSVVYKETHGCIRQGVPLDEAFHASWDPFLSSRPILSCRICIVDDCPMVVKLLQYQLSKAGASVSMVESGDLFLSQGIERDFPWDLVVLDFTMAGRNGLETLQEIPDVVKARLKVIMHTSEPGAGVLEAFLAAGAVKCVPKKPSTYKEIIELVKTVHRSDLAE